jgi:N-acetylglucosaminyl-diphospho-decaprenol L-rhamnosyltransferase
VTSGTLLHQVTIVCVTYKSHPVIDSLGKTLRAFPNVVVVDNASGDGTVAALRVGVPHATVIERARNGGFGTGNNEAMRHVKTPFALMLNPDCDIDADALQCLIDTLHRYPTAGIVAPQSWRNAHTPQMSFRPAFFETKPKGPYQVPDGTCCARWLHGCCLLVRTEAFNHIGGFDEQFFLYYEDDDLCLRMQKSGFECLFEPAAQARHMGGASSTPSIKTHFKKHFHYARSRHLAIRKYLGAGPGGRYLAKTALVALPATLVYTILLQRKHALKWFAWGCSAWSQILTGANFRALTA